MKKIIEIQEEVKIGNVILEPGDKIEILSESNIKRLGNGSLEISGGNHFNGSVQTYAFSPGSHAGYQKKLGLSIDETRKPGDWIELGSMDIADVNAWKDAQNDIAKEWQKVIDYINKVTDDIIRKYS